VGEGKTKNTEKRQEVKVGEAAKGGKAEKRCRRSKRGRRAKTQLSVLSYTLRRIGIGNTHKKAPAPGRHG